MLIKKILKREWTYPWGIVNIIAEIKRNLSGKQIKFQHIMREGNKLVDYIANLAIDIRDYSFVHINNMNSTGRSIFNSDKLKTPYLRITPIRG